ncbi:ABC transporter permease [Parasporobacterium paucivorans]|uniref:Nucleoside ABC transporter membrane protein n=1 Tax=Parasporobacterium paucivorans DSM 15970 TaxID=1122934 RepID=A0A1M6C7N8_9FIRM|nr:ABC transporter permease [Parasporobacterium paucivorans]SHI56963.1 nucleoside ABC transporter membrane protein [Parasporobacterium paucivorans DSM 15970]
MANMNNTAKEPLIRIGKRNELTAKNAMFLRLAAFGLALVAGGVFILAVGHNPISVYWTIIRGSFRSEMAIQATIKYMIPLLITSLGITLAFRMRFWNIGAEGQVIMGAIFASYFALFFDGLPHVLLIILMIIAGIIGGGIWGLIPAFFKVRYNTNETLFTLMLNYIALYIIVFLRDGPWADPESGGFPKIARFSKNAQLDKIFGVQAGWIIGIILVVLVFIYMRYSKHGYEINVVGESKATARYAGMNVRKIVLRTMFISGGICGITGMVSATGSDMTLATAVAGGVGFTAIIVAWLARLNPFTILLVSFLFSVLEKGSTVIQSEFGLSTDSSEVLQGIILFFVLGCEFFVRYRFIRRKKGGTD